MWHSSLILSRTLFSPFTHIIPWPEKTNRFSNYTMSFLSINKQKDKTISQQLVLLGYNLNTVKYVNPHTKKVYFSYFLKQQNEAIRLTILYILYKHYSQQPLDQNPFLTFFIEIVDSVQSPLEQHFVYCILEESLSTVSFKRGEGKFVLFLILILRWIMLYRKTWV